MSICEVLCLGDNKSGRTVQLLKGASLSCINLVYDLKFISFLVHEPFFWCSIFIMICSHSSSHEKRNGCSQYRSSEHHWTRSPATTKVAFFPQNLVDVHSTKLARTYCFLLGARAIQEMVSRALRSSQAGTLCGEGPCDAPDGGDLSVA